MVPQGQDFEYWNTLIPLFLWPQQDISHYARKLHQSNNLCNFPIFIVFVTPKQSEAI